MICMRGKTIPWEKDAIILTAKLQVVLGGDFAAVLVCVGFLRFDLGFLRFAFFLKLLTLKFQTDKFNCFQLYFGRQRI